MDVNKKSFEEALSDLLAEYNVDTDPHIEEIVSDEDLMLITELDSEA